MDKYELNNIQFALEMNWRKKLGVDYFGYTCSTRRGRVFEGSLGNLP
jgi:ribosomal protein L6P/L9E